MRAAAASGSRILTTIPRGTRIPVLGRGEQWSAVQYNRYDGFVMSSYLAFDSEPSGPIPSDPETSHPETEASLTAVVTTPSGTLNLRMNPNAGSQILERIPRSTRLPVLEKGVDWSRVVYLGTAGYVMNSFLTFDQSDSNLEKEPEAEQPEETRPEEDKQENERQQTAYVNTQSGSLNLRRQPGLNSTVLAAIPRNASVNVTAYGSEWCAVQYGGYQGYVMTQYLRFDEAEISAPKTEETPVKETPSEIEQSEETKESYNIINNIYQLHIVLHIRRIVIFIFNYTELHI